jgi:GT2 family glycosyltransferase
VSPPYVEGSGARARRLAVVVLNWNGWEDTAQLLPTLARARVPAGWTARVLVVDNGSTDDSPRKLRETFPDVDVLALPENLRFAGGNNRGLARALDDGADAVMLLNNDTAADPGLYEKLLQALDEDPGAGAASPLIYHAPPSDRIWYGGGRCVPALGLTAHRAIRSRDVGQFAVVEETGYLTGCCLLARREAWERVGPLDEAYFIYAEDADWSLRARRAGYRLLFVPTARLWHRVSASSGGAMSPWKIYQRLRANLTLFARHARGLGRVTWLPSALFQQTLLAGWLLARGRFSAAASVPRGWWDALRGRPASAARLP